MTSAPRRSVGAVLLSRLPMPQDAIAARVGVSREIVNAWANGRKRPGEASRPKLEALGIPVASWDETPSTSTAPNPVAPPAQKDPLSEARDAAVTLMRRVLADPASTPREQGQVVRDAMAAIAQYSKVTGEFEAGPRIMKFAIWRRIEAAITRALADEPAALAKVREEFRREEETDRNGGRKTTADDE